MDFTLRCRSGLTFLKPLLTKHGAVDENGFSFLVSRCVVLLCGVWCFSLSFSRVSKVVSARLLLRRRRVDRGSRRT